MEPLFTYGCILALVYPDLIPSFTGSEGFKVLEVIDGLSSFNSFVFGLVSNDITSFRSLHRLGICVGCSPAPSGVRISRCLFSPDIRDFLSSCHGNHAWRFEICAFSSRLLGVSQCRSCQPERLHRRSLAIAIAVASVSDGFISGAFHLQWCSHLTFVLHVRSCLVPSLASSFLVWLIDPFFSGVCDSFAF